MNAVTNRSAAIAPETVPIFGTRFFAHEMQRALYRFGKGDVFIGASFTIRSPVNSAQLTGSRQPDVLYLAEGRLAQYRAETPDWRILPLILIPDLVIEVVSPTDRLPKVWRKAAIYLDDGVKLVWIVNPMRWHSSLTCGIINQRFV